MKLIIAYDGSRSAEAAIDDLAAAGLPSTGSAEVLSVAEVSLSPAEAVENSIGCRSTDFEAAVRMYQEKGERVLASASILARHAETRIKAALPDWEVGSRFAFGSPAREILRAAQEYRADLILVGSQGLSAPSRLVLGSVSQTLLSEAKCSVRVARGRNEVDPAPARMVIGFDGSKGAFAAIEAVAGRNWSPEAKVKLIAVTESLMPSTIGRFVPPIRRTIQTASVVNDHWIADLARAPLAKLRNAGIDAHFHMPAGNPRNILIREAELWGADCIFVGANAWANRLARIMLGSTASAVAARARCSVEVVRVREQD